ncbi:YkgJ family cysteine cluster protein [Desulfonema ishimotonii]|uniref:YkgJ family cysteine cluster protein n=1 Tax=Desulfonema ishimotonii TaxID=45657 RepID=A0A401FVF0_9BACT|nr:YkgJ family cysteine cluster protein [Desulfonema ishimotonii]GBC60957.1 YkgJ family cysteine cluster protein [Desulfonema ishimotonii]
MKTQENSHSPVSSCRRCGTCCKKGGPSFHREDRSLIEQGIIPGRHLFTIRQGEMAHDNVRKRLSPLPSDLIKIKGKPGTWACVFFDDTENGCTIYEHRPVECRALKCWDTREIERIYTRNRLTRKDLLENVPGLWALIREHRKRCDYGEIRALLEKTEGPERQQALKALDPILRYDENIRNMVIEKGGPSAEMTDFLFGRSLVETLAAYGFKIEKKGERIRIVRMTR